MKKAKKTNTDYSENQFLKQIKESSAIEGIDLPESTWQELFERLNKENPTLNQFSK